MPYGSFAYGTETYGAGDSFDAPTTFPQLVVEIAFTTRPFGTPAWADISSYLRAGNVSRGRSSWLDRVSAGTCTLLLDNRPDPVTGRPFDPLNPDGPFYGYLLPNRRVRVQAVLGYVTYPIFDGFVEDYEQNYERGDNDATCTLTASDALGMFADIELATAVRPIEQAGTRVGAILSNSRVGWPSGQRQIDTGSSILLPVETIDGVNGYDGVKALDALHEVDATEQGRMFVSAGGDFVFVDRNTLVTDSTYTTDQVTFGDDASSDEIPYATVSFDHSRTLIRNTVTVSNDEWGVFRAEDATSILDYGTRTYDVTVIDAGPTSSQSTADNLLRLFKDPQSRVKNVTVKLRRRTATYPDGLFAAVLPIELGWRVGMKRRGANYTIDQSYSVERLTHSFARQWWETGFEFGLPQTDETYWIWGTGQWGTQRWAW